MLAWDTETAKIRPAVLAPEMACLTYSDGVQRRLVWGYEAREHLVWLLQQVTATANGPYDLAVAWSWFPELRDLIWDAVLNGRIYDVITGQKLIEIGEGNYRFVFKRVGDKKAKLNYNLSDINARYFGEFLEKDEWRLSYGEVVNVHPSLWEPGRREYALKDAEVTALCADAQQVQQPWMRRDPSEYLHQMTPQVSADFVLQLMAMRGVATDDRQVHRVIEQIDAEQPSLLRQLVKANLAQRTGQKRTKEAQRRMWMAVGAAGELTDSGAEKVKKGLMTRPEALEKGHIKVDEEWCINSGDPMLKLYNQYDENQRVRGKIVRFLTGALPLHTRYEVLLETGRTSSSESKIVFNSAPMQNLPRKEGLRECVVSRPGFALVAADFGNAELVSLAQVTYNWFEKGRHPGDPWYCKSRMREALNAGRDLHVDFASIMLNISYEEAWRRYQEGDEEMKKYRQWAKPVNFGFPGGLSLESFISYAWKSYGVQLTRAEAKRLHRRWLQAYPEMKYYFRRIRQLFTNAATVQEVLDESDLEQDKKLKLVDMVQEVSGRIRGKCRYTQACNTMFQGLTADGAKAALVEVSRRCHTVPTSALYGSAPVLFIHDEIILEVPLANITRAARELEEIMVEVYSRYTPDVRITADAHAMLRWSKKAKEVRDKTDTSEDPRGRLIPFVDAKFERALDEYAARRRAA